VLREALDTLFEGRPNVLMVHSSLSSCGHFTGGVEDVLDAFQELCTTLVLPTHSYCYPETPESVAPLFDNRNTPSVVGLLTERFRQREGVVRSIHSTHSLAASGPMAEAICKGHYHSETPCSTKTPYGRLLDEGAAVLLFGVSFLYYTLFHTAEDAAKSEYAYHPTIRDRLRFVMEDGMEGERISRRQSRQPYRFTEAGETLIECGLAKRIQFGESQLTLVTDSAAAHRYLVERLRVAPEFLRQG